MTEDTMVVTVRKSMAQHLNSHRAMVSDEADMAVAVVVGGRGGEEGENSEEDEEEAGDGGDEREETADGAVEAAAVEESGPEEEPMNSSAHLSLFLLHRFFLPSSRLDSALLSTRFPVPELQSTEPRIQSRGRQ